MSSSCPTVSHLRDLCGTSHGSANTGAWSGAPDELTLRIIDYHPSSALVLRLVSRELQRISHDFLRGNADEIVARCSNPALPLYRFISVRIQPDFQPNEVQFHLTLSKVIGEFCTRRRADPEAILLPGEVDRFNNEISGDHVQSLWDFRGDSIYFAGLHNRIALANPGLEGIPGNDASAEEIRAWMVANPRALQSVTFFMRQHCPMRFIPAEMGLLTNLIDLVLDNTGLSRMSPGMFNGLPQLQRLDLINADFSASGIPPGTFAGLDQLQNLTLRNCRLEEIAPGTFSGLTQLQELDLHQNGLKVHLPDCFHELVQLRKLKLISNNLRTLISGAFGGLAQLTALDLGQNWLTRMLPSDIFHGLTELRCLNLSYSGLCAIPPNLFNGLTRLEELYLYSNPGLLFFYDGLRGFTNNIAVLGTIDGFFNYECTSPFAKFYQFAAGGPSPEALMESFSGLNDTIKNAVFKMVYDGHPRPEPFDTRWGETHALIGLGAMEDFNWALKRVVREQFEGLSGDQKNAVYGHVYTLAQSQIGAQDADFSDPQWGEHHALENIPRLIDAMHRL